MKSGSNTVLSVKVARGREVMGECSKYDRGGGGDSDELLALPSPEPPSASIQLVDRLAVSSRRHIGTLVDRVVEDRVERGLVSLSIRKEWDIGW